MATESILGDISQEATLSELAEAVKMLAKAIRHPDYISNIGRMSVDIVATTMGAQAVTLASTSAAVTGNSGSIGTTAGAGLTDQTFVAHNIARDTYRDFINKFI